MLGSSALRFLSLALALQVFWLVFPIALCLILAMSTGSQSAGSAALIQWEDGLHSVISLSSIVEPRIPVPDYSVGMGITAKWQGRMYQADIVSIGKLSRLV